MKVNLKKSIKYSSIFLLFIVSNSLYAANELIMSLGQGSSEGIALNDAKKNAVAKVCGDTIISSSNIKLESEKNTKINSGGEASKTLNSTTKSTEDGQSIVAGLIKSFKIINKKNEDSIYTIEIEAIINECKKSEDIQTALTSKALFVELQKINSEIKQLGTSNGVIENPSTFAQKYHNARMLLQRGEVDLALKAYEDIMKEQLIFADPIQDLIMLSKRIYGLEGSKKYIEN